MYYVYKVTLRSLNTGRKKTVYTVKPDLAMAITHAEQDSDWTRFRAVAGCEVQELPRYSDVRDAMEAIRAKTYVPPAR